ncbi:hypothetical protein EVAR_18107_1 [Eumeta japonica]|uniref:Uncharacterized protein n=1 Tax=Eumeta variegata TaxID=151549 RepID=A0A4C1VGJ1_EUMVA|nr:hypothetical protein EVAR_18107_1 [Eumeta japonica]
MELGMSWRVWTFHEMTISRCIQATSVTSLNPFTIFQPRLGTSTQNAGQTSNSQISINGSQHYHARQKETRRHGHSEGAGDEVVREGVLGDEVLAAGGAHQHRQVLPGPRPEVPPLDRRDEHQLRPVQLAREHAHALSVRRKPSLDIHRSPNTSPPKGLETKDSPQAVISPPDRTGPRCDLPIGVTTRKLFFPNSYRFYERPAGCHFNLPIL